MQNKKMGTVKRKGIMTEAVKQICEYVFANSDIIRIYAESFAYNFYSKRDGYCPLTVSDADSVYEWVSDEEVTHFRAIHAEPNFASDRVIKKCGLQFVRYGNWSKLDGSCKMRSMEYERVDV